MGAIRYEVTSVEQPRSTLYSIIRGFHTEINAAVFRRNADGSKDFIAFFVSPYHAENYAKEMSEKAALVPQW